MNIDPMRALPEGERGISAIVGLVLVVGLALGVGLSTYISNWVPAEQSNLEYLTMRQVEESFRDLKSTISSLEPGDGGSAGVKLGAEPVSAYEYARQGATLAAFPARYVDWFSPIADTYVREDENETSYGDDDVLWVSPTAPTDGGDGGGGGGWADVITNGTFQTNTTGWEFSAVAGAPSGVWDAAGYQNGGCAEILSETGKNQDGEGYWEQTISTAIEAGATVTLSYAWKKNYDIKKPGQRDIYVTIFKPDASTADIDSQLGEPDAWGTWYTVTEKDVSSAFDQTGTYSIRLRYDYKTGANDSAWTAAWFDEVQLEVYSGGGGDDGGGGAIPQRRWSYLKFDLHYTNPDDKWTPYLYDSYEDYVFYDDVTIHEAKLWLYCDNLNIRGGEDLQPLDIEIPVTIEVCPLENGEWSENITWENRMEDQLGEALEEQTVGDPQAWVAWDVTSFVEKEFEKARTHAGIWTQDNWQGGRTYPMIQVGKFTDSYDNYYTGDNENNANEELKLAGDNLTGYIESSIYDSYDNDTRWYNVYWDEYTPDNTDIIVRVRSDNFGPYDDPDNILSESWQPVVGGQELNNTARYAQYRIELSRDAATTPTPKFYSIHFTVLVSLCLKEPENSSLERRAAFISKDVATGYYGYRTDIYGEWGQRDFEPYLEIVYSRGARAGKVRRGLVDAGYIKFDPINREFPEQQFIYEGGAIIQQQYGWYEIMIDPPSDFIMVEPADGNNIRVTVTRYRITNEAARAGMAGQSVSGTGWASIAVSIAEESYKTRAGLMPNKDEVTITIRTDHQSAWRDYIRKQLVPRLNFIIGGEWDEYGEWVTYDYDRISITIYGKDGAKREDVDDIYYTEKIVDLNVVLLPGTKT